MRYPRDVVLVGFIIRPMGCGQQPAAVTLTLSLVKPIESTKEAFDLDV